MPEKSSIFCRKFLAQHNIVFKEEMYIFQAIFLSCKPDAPMVCASHLVLLPVPFTHLPEFTHTPIFARSAASVSQLQMTKEHDFL